MTAISSSSLLAQTDGGAMLMMFVLMGLMMYFMIIRPQRRQQKEHQARMASLAKDDKVLTAGGLHGVITHVKERTVLVRVAEGVRLEFEKSSIASILKKGSEPDQADVVVEDAKASS
jgi:preprotein translocase subunit YajC